MLTLSNGQYIEAYSNTTNVSYVISGDTFAGSVESGGILAEGFVQTKKKLYTATGRSEVQIVFANTNQATDTILTVWLQGSKIFEGTMIAGGSATFDGTWKIYNEDGIQMLDSGFERITVSSVFPSNPSIGDLFILI